MSPSSTSNSTLAEDLMSNSFGKTVNETVELLLSGTDIRRCWNGNDFVSGTGEPTLSPFVFTTFSDGFFL